MQLFVRGSETHALEVTGSETVSDIKVINLNYWIVSDSFSEELRSSEWLIKKSN